MADVTVAPLAELPPGTMRLVEHDGLRVGVFNCAGALYALEDRCTHDDGPLCHGLWDGEACSIVCPRHGATFDIASGRPLTLPAYLPARTFPVRVEGGHAVLELD